MTEETHCELEDQQALVDAMLRSVRIRIQACITPSVSSHLFLEKELMAEARRALERGQFFPLVRMFDRLALNEREQLTLWVLLAHELDLEVRRAIRELNTEEVADPTLDTIRRVVYGRDRVNAMKELSERGTLRLRGLIERSDADETSSDHRGTFKVPSWLVGLASGIDDLDRLVADIELDDRKVAALDGLVFSENCRAAFASALCEQGMTVVTGRRGTGRRSLVVATAHAHDLNAADRLPQAVIRARDDAATATRHCARIHRSGVHARALQP